MAITLGGITLPDLIIDNEFGRNGVRSLVEKSMGGRDIVWEDTEEGIDLTLFGGSDWGWIDYSVLVQIQALSNVPNADYVLNYEGTLYDVRFKNEAKPVISADKLRTRPNPDSDDEYNNLVIKLVEI